MSFYIIFCSIFHDTVKVIITEVRNLDFSVIILFTKVLILLSERVHIPNNMFHI